MAKTYLTPHFTLEEMTYSKNAAIAKIDNKPSQQHIEALTLLCIKVLEPLRVIVDAPINVTSGYRTPTVNRLAGGSRTSQHKKGEAADIKIKGLAAQELFEIICKSDLPFDQVIQEFDQWVHVSFSVKRQRRSMLYATKNEEGETVYTRAKFPAISPFVIF